MLLKTLYCFVFMYMYNIKCFVIDVNMNINSLKHKVKTKTSVWKLAAIRCLIQDFPAGAGRIKLCVHDTLLLMPYSIVIKPSWVTYIIIIK